MKSSWAYDRKKFCTFLKCPWAKGTEGIAHEKFPMTLARSPNFKHPDLSEIISLQRFTIVLTFSGGKKKDRRRELTTTPRYSRT
jgi:hypothetical protein